MYFFPLIAEFILFVSTLSLNWPFWPLKSFWETEEELILLFRLILSFARNASPVFIACLLVDPTFDFDRSLTLSYFLSPSRILESIKVPLRI